MPPRFGGMKTYNWEGVNPDGYFLDKLEPIPSALLVLAAQPVTTNLLKFMRASIKMIGVSNLQSFIASMTQKLTLSDISDESKNYLDKAGITTACLRIKSKWTAGGK